MGHHVKSSRVTTRKIHSCWGCQRTIPAKTVDIEVCVSVDMGKIYTIYTRAVCEAVMDEWHDEDREYVTEGMVKDGDPESWEEIRAEVEGAQPT